MLNKQRVCEIDRLDDVAATKLYTATGPYWPILGPQNRSNHSQNLYPLAIKHGFFNIARSSMAYHLLDDPGG